MTNRIFAPGHFDGDACLWHRWRHGTCDRPPRGWFCTLDHGHKGPCPTVARWWNVRAQIQLGERGGWGGMR